MSTCRVTSLNASSTARPAIPPQAVMPVVEPALVFHTDYEWNSSGTRIRCAHKQCGEVLSVSEPGDVEEAEALYSVHQQEALGTLPVELAALRALKASIPGILADLAHGVPLLRIEADLFRELNEADYAIGNARALRIEEAAVAPAPEPETAAEPVVPEAAVATPPEVIPEPVPESAPEPGTAPEAVVPAAVEETVAPEPDLSVPEPEPSSVEVGHVAAGDRVLAVFNTVRHGVFEMEATVISGLGQDQLVAGSYLISSNGVASAHLQEVTVLAAAGIHDHPVKPGSTAPEHFGTGI